MLQTQCLILRFLFFSALLEYITKTQYDRSYFDRKAQEACFGSSKTFLIYVFYIQILCGQVEIWAHLPGGIIIDTGLPSNYI